jgi:chromosome segregation protein
MSARHALQEAVAELRRVEAVLELRGSGIARTARPECRAGRLSTASVRRSPVLEQAIQHARDLRQRQGQELEQAEQGILEIRQHIERDQDLLAELNRALGALGPELDAARAAEAASAEALRSAEQAMQDWQAGWEAFNREASEARETVEVERARIEQLDGQSPRLAKRRERLEAERAAAREPARTRTWMRSSVSS